MIFFRTKILLFKFILLILINIIFSSCTKDEITSYNEPQFSLEVINHGSDVNFVLNEPWEKIGIGYINVIRTDSLWQLWYEAFDEHSQNKGKIDYNGYFCYATSKDGINWTKPNLSKTKYKGNYDNNILISSNDVKNNGIHGVTVFIDSLAHSDEKYKMIYARWVDSLSSNWVYGMTSPDGINWDNQRLLIEHYSDTQTVCFNDNGSYKIYLRYWNGGSHGKGMRQIGYCETFDFTGPINN